MAGGSGVKAIVDSRDAAHKALADKAVTYIDANLMLIPEVYRNLFLNLKAKMQCGDSSRPAFPLIYNTDPKLTRTLDGNKCPNFFAPYEFQAVLDNYEIDLCRALAISEMGTSIDRTLLVKNINKIFQDLADKPEIVCTYDDRNSSHVFMRNLVKFAGERLIDYLYEYYFDVESGALKADLAKYLDELDQAVNGLSVSTKPPLWRDMILMWVTTVAIEASWDTNRRSLLNYAYIFVSQASARKIGNLAKTEFKRQFNLLVEDKNFIDHSSRIFASIESIRYDEKFRLLFSKFEKGLVGQNEILLPGFAKIYSLFEVAPPTPSSYESCAAFLKLLSVKLRKYLEIERPDTSFEAALLFNSLCFQIGETYLMINPNEKGLSYDDILQNMVSFEKALLLLHFKSDEVLLAKQALIYAVLAQKRQYGLLTNEGCDILSMCTSGFDFNAMIDKIKAEFLKYKLIHLKWEHHLKGVALLKP